MVLGGIMAKGIWMVFEWYFEGLDYRQSCSGNKDFFALIARATFWLLPELLSGNKREKTFLLPEQKWIDGDIFSEHLST